ncbi:phosphate system positive regulatory protein pho81, partial [Spiromyces aspiralis]
AQAFPEWASYYMNYKALKKIINELSVPITQSTTDAHKEDSVARFERVKAAFFFQLDRELEKVNAFYIQKEKDMEQRLRILSEKYKTVERRMSQSKISTIVTLHEALYQFQHDLDKLQASSTTASPLPELSNFIEINGTGFSKILKKWDKRSKSSTKELYLARQVEVQPCFNKEVITTLTDQVARTISDIDCLLEKVRSQQQSQDAEGDKDYAIPVAPSLRTGDKGIVTMPGSPRPSGPEEVYEDRLFQALLSDKTGDAYTALERLKAVCPKDYQISVSRVLWRLCAEPQADNKCRLLLESGLIRFDFCDEINEQTFCHRSSANGVLSVLEAAVGSGISPDTTDYYNRRPLHYAAMGGHAGCLRFLLRKGANTQCTDDDGNRPLDYAVMNGHGECVALLIESLATATGPPETGPILCLACQRGHYDVAKFLLDSGIPMTPNAQGLHPLHIAAREGSVQLARLLIDRGSAMDPIDNDLGWTPLFYAASEGHAGCLDVLLSSGCKVDVIDEAQRSAVYYAANEGHIGCVEMLLAAGCVASYPGPVASETPRQGAPDTFSPGSEGAPAPTAGGAALDEIELDGIPSLSLPPPIIPFRIYGHTYLDRSSQITIKLAHGLGHAQDHKQPVSFQSLSHLRSLRLVVSGKPDAGMVPHTVMLPLETDEINLGFKTADPDEFGLEFCLYPSLGTELIGKAVTLPSMFKGTSLGSITLPIMDRNLKSIAEISFEFSVIRPFFGAQLKIGGKIETYWKSTNPPEAAGGIASATSSAIATSATVGGNGGLSLITASSLASLHINIHVQVTADQVPVLWHDDSVTFDHGIKVPVDSLNYQQLTAIVASKHQGADFEPMLRRSDAKPEAWHALVKNSGISLERLLEILPSGYGLAIHIEHARPCGRDGEERVSSALQRQRCIVLHSDHINRSIDSVLRVMYNDAQKRLGDNGRTKPRESPVSPHDIYRDSQDGQQRSILFVSSDPV